MGLTPKAAARRIRLGRAVRLLNRDPEREIGAVAVACDYADQSHFTREFRELAGCTPAAYRCRILNGSPRPRGAANLPATPGRKGA
jgi:AraC-like DNA-binding protein